MPSLGDKRVFSGVNQVFIPGAGWITDTSTGVGAAPSPGQAPAGTRPRPRPVAPPPLPAPVVPRISAGGDVQQAIQQQAPTPLTFDPRLLQAGRGTNRIEDTLRPLSAGPAFDQLPPPGARGGRVPGAVRPATPPLAQTPAVGAFLKLLADTAGGAFGGAVDTAFAQINNNIESDRNFLVEAADVAGAALAGGVGGGIDAAQQSIQESITGEKVEREIAIEGPANTDPWWKDFPGGLGTFDEIRQSLQAGVLIPDVTPQLQLALGFSDTDMREAGYVFDEATGKWILPDSQGLEDAQAGLGGGGGAGGGFAPFSFNLGGGGGGGGGFSFPSTPRTAQGNGLTNWRI